MASLIDISVNEVSVFPAITILMPEVKKHKVLEYWYTDPLLKTLTFVTIFARDRYLSLF